MPLPHDLLEQARALARHEQGRGRPRQSSLRRSVSTAYYATFHLLASDAADQCAPGDPPGLRERVQRAIQHETMKKAANSFGSANPPGHVRNLLQNPISTRLSALARSFARLQDERHSADYDLADTFTRARVQGLLREAESVFTEWRTLRNTSEGRVFLASLMFWDRWSK